MRFASDLTFSIDIVCAIVYDVNSEGDEALTQKEKLLRKMKSSPHDVGLGESNLCQIGVCHGGRRSER